MIVYGDSSIYPLGNYSRITKSDLIMKSLFLATLFALTTTFATAAELNDSADRDVTWLFAVNASSGSVSGETLTLTISPHVIYFSDRPNRLAGNISATELVALWKSTNPNSFAEDPPNAVINLFENTDDESAVITLSKPSLQGNKLSFHIKTIEGSLPREFAHASVFIDGYCEQLNCGDTNPADNKPLRRNDG